MIGVSKVKPRMRANWCLNLKIVTFSIPNVPYLGLNLQFTVLTLCFNKDSGVGEMVCSREVLTRGGGGEGYLSISKTIDKTIAPFLIFQNERTIRF